MSQNPDPAGDGNAAAQVKLNNETVGTIFLKSDMNAFYLRALWYIIMVIISVGISLFAAYLLVSKLQRSITDPIFDLSRLMNIISNDKNYSERAVVHNDDELGKLARGFNHMMQAIQTKNGELEEAYKEISYRQAKSVQQEKMASIGQLAAGVAHEINNPTGFISSNLGALGRYSNKLAEFIHAQGEALSSDQSPEVLEKLKGIRKKLKIDYVLEDLEELIKESLDGTDRIKRIVKNLKTFARIDEKECKLADLNKCIESTLNIVWNEIKYKANVEKEYGDIPLTKCFPQKLNQVFMNLLVNASQAIEEKGKIKIKTWNGDEFINISISDTGQGIPEDRLNRIFEPFYTTKVAGVGTGLGLSISYDIVKENNGEITVDSEVGKGTTFHIKIPIVE